MTFQKLCDDCLSNIHLNDSLNAKLKKDTIQIVRLAYETFEGFSEGKRLIEKMESHSRRLLPHSVGVAIISIALAIHSKQFSARQLSVLALAALLHDIGYLLIDPELVQAPRELNFSEWNEMQKHPLYGLRLLEPLTFLPIEVKSIVYQHHHEPSAPGYPAGLHEKNVNPLSRFVALADAYYALISERPYRPAFTAVQSFQLLQAESLKWDRDLIRALSTLLQKKD